MHLSPGTVCIPSASLCAGTHRDYAQGICGVKIVKLAGGLCKAAVSVLRQPLRKPHSLDGLLGVSLVPSCATVCSHQAWLNNAKVSTG